MITVYTVGSSCMQCEMTKRAMDASGLAYEDVDLTSPVNSSAREYVTDDLGYSTAPVVVVNDHDHWVGFRPDRIKALAARRAAASPKGQGS